MSDTLKIDLFNSLPHPISCRLWGDDTDWMVETICVETGLMRIDVHGMLSFHHFDDVCEVVGADGDRYKSEIFYIEDTND